MCKLTALNIDIISLNETWLTSFHTNSSLFLNGYQIIRLDRPTHGGGVCFLVKNGISATIENSLMLDSIEMLHIIIKPKFSKPLNIIFVYKAPTVNINDMLAHFGNFLNNIDYNNIPLIILGDFNINLKTKNATRKQLLAFFADYGLEVANSEPTRNTLTSNSLIDLAVFNKLALSNVDKQSITNHVCGFSDHDLITFIHRHKVHKPKTKPLTIFTKSYSKPNMDKLLCSLKYIDMSLLPQTTVDELVHDYLIQVNLLIEQNLDHRARRVSGNHHPWINNEFIKLAHERDKLFSRARKEKSQTLLCLAKNLRNNCTSLARKLKSDYFHEKIMKYKHNPKMLWKELKPLYNDTTQLSSNSSFKTN